MQYKCIWSEVFQVQRLIVNLGKHNVDLQFSRLRKVPANFSFSVPSRLLHFSLVGEWTVFQTILGSMTFTPKFLHQTNFNYTVISLKVFLQFLTELVNPAFVWGLLTIFREKSSAHQESTLPAGFCKLVMGTAFRV